MSKSHENTENMRLNKYLAHCGVCSRRDADNLIAAGRVRVNGVPADMGQGVGEGDEVCVDGKAVGKAAKKVVLAFNKPVGVVCTERDAHAEIKISDVIKYPLRVTYAGRLDKESEGLLLLTNDGDLTDAIMRGANGHEKEYTVRVNKKITDVFLSDMEKGVYLSDLDQTTRPCKVRRLGEYTFRIVLTQGLNRQIRRMCRELGYHAQYIRRVRVMNVWLGELKPGEYRELTARECAELYERAGLSHAKPQNADR